MTRLEYIWLDGSQPTKQLRSKVKYVSHLNKLELESEIRQGRHDWSFDGSSTNQASGHDSDCILKPIRVYRDPMNPPDSFLLLCEVYDYSLSDENEIPNKHNTRRKLSNLSKEYPDVTVGFEQEYVLMQNGLPLGFPDKGFPSPQGQYYCGNGSENNKGRELVEEHAYACLRAELYLYGTNSEVLLGQHEFQIGPRSGENFDIPNALRVADDLWVARFLLIRLAEKYGYSISFDCKPVKGDWNGSGLHTNFSTETMRSDSIGTKAIKEAIKKLSKKHKEHIAVYGYGLEERLTGAHETCSIDEFKSGVANRGASIRIPHHVQKAGKGYLEDRRPGANADGYEVAAILIETICKK